MDILTKVKLSNYYDLVVGSLYKQDGTTPITDIEGTTALLTTNGTSWEFLDESWSQIELSTDQMILNSFYPFITSICNSIQNNFVKCQLSMIYEGVTLSKDSEKSEVTISGLLTPPKVIARDYIIIRNYAGSYLTVVKSVTDTTIVAGTTGLDVRISGQAETIGVLFVSFPPDFLDSAINMLGYDMFKREDKEKRQERLGNYTYTNFEPVEYYGTGEYPVSMQRKIQFWQKIHV